MWSTRSSWYLSSPLLWMNNLISWKGCGWIKWQQWSKFDIVKPWTDVAVVNIEELKNSWLTVLSKGGSNWSSSRPNSSRSLVSSSQLCAGLPTFYALPLVSACLDHPKVLLNSSRVPIVCAARAGISRRHFPRISPSPSLRGWRQNGERTTMRKRATNSLRPRIQSQHHWLNRIVIRLISRVLWKRSSLRRRELAKLATDVR